MAFRPYLSIVHHVPGRIRLRFGTEVLGRFGAGRLSAFAEGARASGAVRSFRVNPMARSLAIEYDPVCLPPALWGRFLDGDDEEAADIAARLAPHLGDKSKATGKPLLSEEGSS